MKSFKRWGISNTLDGSEDDQIRNEIPKDELDEEKGDEEEDEDDINDFDLFNNN